jgi:hypothetical protein
MKEILKFIKDNKLEFDLEGSGLNGNCVILAGFACYLELTDSQEIIDAIKEIHPTSDAFDAEFERVFDYANSNNYKAWWLIPEAKKLYKFTIKK